ncbi:hypothetical protein D3C78_1817940 [compost metagenome]
MNVTRSRLGGSTQSYSQMPWPAAMDVVVFSTESQHLPPMMAPRPWSWFMKALTSSVTWSSFTLLMLPSIRVST